MKPDRPASTSGIALIRVSNPKVQDTQSQRLPIDNWANRLGLKITDWVDDAGSRDKARDRPAFQRLLRRVEAGHLDDQFIVVDHSDRFGTKHPYEFGKFMSLLLDHDVELWSVAEGLISSVDDATVILNSVAKLKSTAEQKDKARRSIRGKVDLARTGHYVGSRTHPYSYDVGVFGPDGNLRYQVHQEIMAKDEQRRWKVWPDGRRELYEGKGNRPAKDRHDKLFLVPSADPRRAELVQTFFRLFTSESWGLCALANMANGLGLKPIGGWGRWTASNVKRILTNPVYYIGRSVWNKSGYSARHVQWLNGNYSEVPKTKDEPAPVKVKSREDWIGADQTSPYALVSKDVWDLAQAKLNRNKGKRVRNVRHPDLWLADLLVCKRCGKRMYAQQNPSGSPRRQPPVYRCQSYVRLGSASGCQVNRVRADRIARLVEDYLAEAGRRAEILRSLVTPNDSPLIDELDEALSEKAEQVIATWKDMEGFVRKVVEEEVAQAPEDVKKFWEGVLLDFPASEQKELLALYRRFFSKRQERLSNTIAHYERQFEDQFEQFKNLSTKKAMNLANREMERLERIIEELKAESVNLADRYETLAGEFNRLEERIFAAVQSLTGSSERAKAEAVGAVIDRIELTFEDVPDAASKRPKARLVQIEIIPKGDGLEPKSHCQDGTTWT